MRSLWCLLLFFCLSTASLALDLKVALGAQDVRPTSSSLHTASLSAFNEELAREICRRIRAHCTMVYGPMGEILTDVEAGRMDLGFGSYLRTPEREARVDFSLPVWRSSSRLAASTTTSQKFSRKLGAPLTLDKLRDARVVAIDGSVQYRVIQKMAENQSILPVAAQTMADLFETLRSGRADFSLLPTLAAYSMLRSEQPGTFEFVGEPIMDSGLGGTVHIALPKKREALRNQVDDAITEIRADGTFHRIVRRHFPFSLD